jgi:hypothetical protein
MALSIVQQTPKQLSPHRQALADNMRAIRALREKLNTIAERDRAAAADIALCDATQQQIASVQQEIDTQRANAIYSGESPPDVSKQEKKLAHLSQLLKTQSDTARAATLIRAKYSAELTIIHHAISERAKAQPQLLFDAVLEDCLAPLAAEFLAAEQAFLAVHKKVFAAALAVDTYAKENQNGRYVNSGNIDLLRISRPSHPAFDPHPDYTVEQRHAEQRAYIASAERDAAALVNELLSIAD